MKEYYQKYKLTHKDKRVGDNKRDRGDYQINWKFGINREEYNKMFTEQRGCCIICQRHQNEFKKSLAVDYCHMSNKIRGLLCGNCNTALGSFKDSEESLIRAIAYINGDLI